MSSSFQVDPERVAAASGDIARISADIERQVATMMGRLTGLEGSIIVRQVEQESGAVGLNALTGEFEDLLKAGVIDPAKVTRSALQNAASIAALFLTTEAVIADKPEKNAPAAPGGDGGMGGMDF